MAKQERLMLLEENVTDLRNLGKTWHLDEETVDNCAQSSLNMKTVSEDDISVVDGLFRSIRQLGNNGLSMRTLKVALLVIVIGGIAVGYVVQNEERINEWILQDMFYEVMRRIRLMTVFLHRLIKIKGLEDDAVQLFRFGRSWGLTNEEIEDCITKALYVDVLNIKTKHLKIPTKSIPCRQNKGHRLKVWILWLLFGSFVLCPVVGLFVMGTETGLNVIEIALQIPPQSGMMGRYHVMRYYRQFATALTTKLNFHLEDYYDAECIVYNPLWTNPYLPDCDVCESVKEVRQLNHDVRALNLDLYDSPLIYKNLLPSVVSLEDVTAVIQRSKVELSTPVKSSARWSRTAREFADNATVDKINNLHEFHFHWRASRNLLVGQVMRHIFPRPSVFDNTLEVSLDKFLYVDGPNSKGYQLDDFIEPGYDWYSQGFGVRTLHFSPSNKTCIDQCSTFQITVSQRDVLIYVAGIWDVVLLDNGEDISIGYLGHLISLH